MLDLLAPATDVPGLPGGLASLGVIAFALVVGIALTYKWGVVPERERAARLEDEVKRLNIVMVDRVIPALVSATELLAHVKDQFSQPPRWDRSGTS